MAKRWRSVRPQYITPIIFEEKLISGSGTEAAAALGTQTRGTGKARVVKAFDTWTLGDDDYPDTAPPATNFIAPGTWDGANTASGWRAWWPVSPDDPGPTYEIPDPPEVARPIQPTARYPILWTCAGVVGESGRRSWERMIGSIYAKVDFIPQTGHEMLRNDQDLSVTYATLKVRPQVVTDGNISSKKWRVVLQSDLTQWDIESIIPSYNKSEYLEIIVRGVE